MSLIIITIVIRIYIQNCCVTMTVVVLEEDIAPGTLVTITIVIVILELVSMLKLLINMTIVIVKNSNRLKFKASYIENMLLHT